MRWRADRDYPVGDVSTSHSCSRRLHVCILHDLGEETSPGDRSQRVRIFQSGLGVFLSYLVFGGVCALFARLGDGDGRRAKPPLPQCIRPESGHPSARRTPENCRSRRFVTGKVARSAGTLLAAKDRGDLANTVVSASISEVGISWLLFLAPIVGVHLPTKAKGSEKWD